MAVAPLDHHSTEADFEDVVDPLDRAAWRKSAASENDGACVELAVLPNVTGIRDTKQRAAGRLTLSDAARAALIGFASNRGMTHD